jgi:succinate dehydrogenase / fumarate reductase membrane anchor subunit
MIGAARKDRPASAHPGLSHWRWQRVSAMVLVPLILWTLWMMRSVDGGSYLSAKAWIQGIGPKTALLLLVPLSYFHGALGLQVIIEDYLRPPFRSPVIWLVRLAAVILSFVTLWAIFSAAST